MTEEQKEQLFTWAKQAVEFGAEQAPLLVDEIIRYAVVSSTAGLFLCFLGLVSAWVLFRKAINMPIKTNGDIDRQCLFSALGVCALVFSIIGMAFNATTLLKATIAPRVYVLEKIVK